MKPTFPALIGPSLTLSSRSRVGRWPGFVSSPTSIDVELVWLAQSPQQDRLHASYSSLLRESIRLCWSIGTDSFWVRSERPSRCVTGRSLDRNSPSLVATAPRLAARPASLSARAFVNACVLSSATSTLIGSISSVAPKSTPRLLKADSGRDTSSVPCSREKMGGSTEPGATWRARWNVSKFTGGREI